MKGVCEYVRIAGGQPLPDISAFRPFKAIVVIDAPYSPEWQDLVSKWLVDSGCHYMMAWGEGCASWDDSVDWAILEEFEHCQIPAERYVMTSWHENQPARGGDGVRPLRRGRL